MGDERGLKCSGNDFNIIKKEPVACSATGKKSKKNGADRLWLEIPADGETNLGTVLVILRIEVIPPGDS